MNLQITIDETVWQPRVDQFNKDRKAQHDSAELIKPEAERTPYVPVNVQQYAKDRMSDIERSYAAQSVHEQTERAKALPEFAEIVAAMADPAKRAKLKAAAKAVALALLFAFGSAGCETVDIPHKEIAGNGHCLKNSQNFAAAYDKTHSADPDKWRRVLLVRQVAQHDAGDVSVARVNPLATSRTQSPAVWHAVTVFQHDGRLWSYDDATIGSPFPLTRDLRLKESPEELARLARRLDPYAGAMFLPEERS